MKLINPCRFGRLNPPISLESSRFCAIHQIIRTNLPTPRHASHSSHSWLERQRKDIYKRMSRYDNYRARSAYKLIQIDDKYKFLKPGKVVIEAGAAPGSWTQVICDRLKLTEKDNKKAQSGLCLAIDIAAIEPVEGAICLGNADFTSPFTQGKLLTWLDGRKADCVLSDMAPSASGHKFLDHTRVIKLINQLTPFAFQVLRPETGVLLAKIWDGNETVELVERLGQYFDRVKNVKPDASRGDSSEMYILCMGFRGPPTLGSGTQRSTEPAIAEQNRRSKVNYAQQAVHPDRATES